MTTKKHDDINSQQAKDIQLFSLYVCVYIYKKNRGQGLNIARSNGTEAVVTVVVLSVPQN